jgi:tetratricopeptide (TPR) repeat protein
MPLLLLLSLVLTTLCMPSRAATAAQHFQEANKLFEEHKYKEAVRAYNSIAADYGVSPSLFFNLGNAFFRDENIAGAVLSYRRAELLAPRDPDVQANLSFARDTVGGVPLHGPGYRLLTYFKLNEITAVCVTLFWIVCLSLMLSLLKPSLERSLRSTTTTLALLFIFSLGWVAAAYWISAQSEGVVMVKEAAIRFGPLDESQTVYTAREGTELRILGKKEGWFQVADGSSRIGWVNVSSVTVIAKPLGS